RLPQPRARRLGPDARRSPVGPGQEQPDPRADRGARRWLVPGQRIRRRQAAAEGPGRGRGAGDRLPVARPGPADQGEGSPLGDYLAGRRGHPTEELVMLYHRRWEEDLAIDEVKAHQEERPVLRSQTPLGVVQEVEGLLLGHYAVRKVMFEAAS